MIQDLRYGIRMLLKHPGFHLCGRADACPWNRGPRGTISAAGNALVRERQIQLGARFEF